MLKYYIKIAFRNFIKYKSYFLISVAGLAIGLAVCIMLLLYVQNEFSYDRYNENSDNIYRLIQDDHTYHSPQTAKILADGIPEIEDYGRLLVTWGKILEYGEHKFKETDMIYADPAIFNSIRCARPCRCDVRCGWRWRAGAGFLQWLAWRRGCRRPARGGG